MLRRSSIALASALYLGAGGVSPTFAQSSNPLEWLFGKKSEPERAAPAEAEPTKPAPAAQPAKRPAARPAAPAGPQAQGGQPGSAAPVNQAPAAAGNRNASAPAPAPGQAVAAVSPAAPAPAAPLTEQQIVTKANAYFNTISSLVGDFVQTGGDGRRLGGKLYLQRPGKIRFEYDAPATLEVVADGSSVAVRDRKLATQDLYLIAQTPLKFLLRERIDLGQDLRLLSASMEAEGARIQLEDRSTLGGTSKITLFFDPKLETLLRWRIVDPQGFTTIVALSNLDKARRVDNRLFVINYERMLDTR